MSWRRLGALIRYLPAESATAFERHGDDARWGLPEQLLAAIVDVLNGANWQRAGDKKQPKPEPVPRPGVTRHRRPSPAETLARLEDFRRRTAERR